MEIGSKILELRKQKNITQEELADKVGVSRQTISKWELGETSPDLKEAKELSKIFNVSIDELADNDNKELLASKVSNTEKLAGLILKFLKIFGIFVLILFIISIISFIFLIVQKKNRAQGRIIEKTITCELYGEEHAIGFRFYEESGVIIEAGGDGYFTNITDIEKYGDAYQAIDKIDAYVKDRNGTCEVTDK